MTFAYCASFKVTDPANGFGTIAFASAGKSTVTVFLSSVAETTVAGNALTAVYNHARDVGLGSAVSEDRGGGLNMGQSYGFNTFALALQTKVRADALSWSNQANLGINFSNTTLKYTLSFAATLTVTFSNAATARLFGFTSLSLTGATSYESTMTPYFIIRPSLPGVCAPSPVYEPDGIAVQGVSAAGSFFGLARTGTPLYCDWIQQYEPPEKTERLRALTTSHPYTHQALAEDCRTGIPFVVIDGGFGDSRNRAFALRAEGSAWNPERASPGNGAQFHIPYKALVLGTVTS